ncbi:MAG: peptidase MA family metallohydrolase [Chloroflexota bacterium]
MLKKTRVLLAAIMLLVLSPAPVQAESALRVLDSSAEVEFPQRLTFNLSVEGESNITDIRLNYIVRMEGFTTVVSEGYVNFKPARRVAVSWPLEMVRINGLPPGTWVDYWWRVRDESGGELVTPSAQIEFTDQGYPWQELTEGQVTIYWYEGGSSFAQTIMASAQDGLARLSRDTGVTPAKPVRLFIYASPRDLLESMINPQEWTGGVHFARFDVITIGIPLNELEWGKRAVVHELTHLIIGQITFNPYSGLPVWLNEGLAVYNEGEFDPALAQFLTQAIKENSVISVRSLASPFSALSSRAYLSYAESRELVEFLISRYGSDKMFKLLLKFREGTSYDAAFMEVYGFDMDGLNTIWQETLKTPEPTGKVAYRPRFDSSAKSGFVPPLALGIGKYAFSRN